MGHEWLYFPTKAKAFLPLLLFLNLFLGVATAEAQPLPCEAEALAAIDLTRSTLDGIDLPFFPTLVLNFSLNAADSATRAGNVGAAIVWLNFFQNRVRFNETNGNLSSVDADALIQLADEAILLLSNCTSTPRVLHFNVRSDALENTLFWVNPGTNYNRTIIRVRTDTFPAGPADGMAIADVMGTPGARDSTVHGPLTPGTTYFYSAFVDDGGGTISAPKHSFGQPRDDSGPFNWSYTVGGALPIPGVDAFDRYYALASDALHAVDPGATGGGWPGAWKPVSLPGPPSVSRPLPVPAAGLVFISGRGGTVTARDLDGNPVWESPVLGTAIDASVSADVGAGLVFVGARVDNGDSTFYGLNLADGQIAWQFDNGGGATGMGPIVGASGWSDGRVYFTSTQKPFGSGTTETLFSLSYTASSVTKQWSASIGDSETGIGLSFNGSFQPTNLYAANTAGEVFAFDITPGNEGTQKWVYDTLDGPLRAFPFSVFDTEPVFFTTDNEVHAVDQTGNAIWKFTQPGLDPSPVTVLRIGGPSRIYFGGGDNVIYSIRASDGGDVRTFVVGPGPGKFGSPAIDVGGLLLIGSDRGVLFGLDLF